MTTGGSIGLGEGAAIPEDQPASVATSPTTTRIVGTFTLDLSVRGNRLRVPMPTGTQAVYVTARTMMGSWSTAAVAVRIGAPGGAIDFATPKTIPAGGGYVAVAADDASGLPEIVVGLDPTTTPEASAWAVFTITADVK